MTDEISFVSLLNDQQQASSTTVTICELRVVSVVSHYLFRADFCLSSYFLPTNRSFKEVLRLRTDLARGGVSFEKLSKLSMII